MRYSQARRCPADDRRMRLPALRFQNVSKRYAGQSVLEGIDLTLEDGECMALVGVNGCGKTSLIKCLLDLCAIDGGQIAIFGQDHRHSAARAPLAYLPERFVPPYYLDGQGFLKYMLELQGIAYDREAVTQLLLELELGQEALSKPVRDYSKGMTQKLGLAACLLANKRAYVLDEPMSGLDPKARALLKLQLQQCRSRGSSLFFATHALADLDALSDRLAILHEGSLRFVGTPAQLCTQTGEASLEQAFLRCIG